MRYLDRSIELEGNCGIEELQSVAKQYVGNEVYLLE